MANTQPIWAMRGAIVFSGRFLIETTNERSFTAPELTMLRIEIDDCFTRDALLGRVTPPIVRIAKSRVSPSQKYPAGKHEGSSARGPLANLDKLPCRRFRSGGR